MPQPPTDKITLRELLTRGQELYRYLIGRWLRIGGCVLLAGILGLVYTFRRPTYTAETTFALEENTSMNQLAGLASDVGFQVGSISGDEDNLFKGENILELYKSKRMLIETLLEEADTTGDQRKLIYLFAKELKWDKKWSKKPYLANLSFDVPRGQFTHSHDSLLLEAVELLREKYVKVDKPSRRLNIISVKVDFKDPIFARRFNTELVRNVSEFYFFSKTRKSYATVATLQHQADSIKAVIDSNMMGIATRLEETPYVNSLYRSNTVPIQQKQMDLQSSYTAYAEIVKNLEIAKLTYFDRQPLIQVIDKPLNYLENNKWKWYKGLIIGLFLGGFFSVAFYILRFLFKTALQEG